MKADMPVQKFRSIEDMSNAAVPHTGLPDFERFLRHCARYWAIAPRVYPRGVFKFRTIEDAQNARDLTRRPRSVGAGPRERS
jgi:hypothetical protein